MGAVATTDHKSDSTFGNKALAGPGSFYQITPSNSADLPAVVRAIRCPEDGFIALVPRDPVPGVDYETNGSLIHPCTAGEVIVGYVKQVTVLGSTAFVGKIIGYT